MLNESREPDFCIRPVGWVKPLGPQKGRHVAQYTPRERPLRLTKRLPVIKAGTGTPSPPPVPFSLQTNSLLLVSLAVATTEGKVVSKSGRGHKTGPEQWWLD